MIVKIPSSVRAARWRTLFLVVALAVGALPLSAPEPAEAAGARPDGPLVPAAGFYVGAYTKHPDGYNRDKQQAAITDMEAQLGRRLHIDHHFYEWGDEFPTWREPWDLENGRIPMISWNGKPAYASDIAAGRQDHVIVARANAVKALGSEVFIRWFWEMDGNKKAEFAQGPDNYKAAWKRIVDIFRQLGATNAVWVWCPNASAIGDREAMPFYPGPEYVDWVCGDGYNFAPNRPGDPWESFDQIFDSFYREGVKLKKPLMIGEFGVLERGPGEKGAWFHQSHDIVAERYPAIAALVYFNADSTTNGIEYDWRVTTSPEAFEGFRYMFTGPAPIPKHAPPPAAVEPVTTTTAAPKPPVTPKPVTLKPVTLQPPAAPRPATTPTPAKPTRPALAAPEPKTPSPRLVWVLELLRRLDYSHAPVG